MMKRRTEERVHRVHRHAVICRIHQLGNCDESQRACRQRETGEHTGVRANPRPQCAIVLPVGKLAVVHEVHGREHDRVSPASHSLIARIGERRSRAEHQPPQWGTPFELSHPHPLNRIAAHGYHSLQPRLGLQVHDTGCVLRCSVCNGHKDEHDNSRDDENMRRRQEWTHYDHRDDKGSSR